MADPSFVFIVSQGILNKNAKINIIFVKIDTQIKQYML